MYPTIRLACLSMAVGALVLVAPGRAEAKPISGAELGRALELCLLAPDSRTAETDDRFACCSRELGFCVVCPQPPSAGNVCQIQPHRRYPLGRPAAQSPATQTPGTLAPPEGEPVPPAAADQLDLLR